MAKSAVITRFAPSPTGPLHLGHLWSAIISHDLARAAGGRFLLRIEDIDVGRCREEFVAGIEADLRWAGLNWDGPIVRQSARMKQYRAALEQLEALDLLYRCWCTRAEIAAASAGAPQGENGPIYPGTCRTRTAPAEGAGWCWRLKMDEATRLAPSLNWHDATAGRIEAQPHQFGDVILARKDIPTSYHLSVVVDDAAQGVTDIVRGKDLFAATHVHRLLQVLLGLPEPRYHHHELVTGPDGVRLAKRTQAPAIAALRADGADPLLFVSDMRAGRFPIGFALSAA